MDVTVFSAETSSSLILVRLRLVELDHLGMWFADPADAVSAGCPDTVTPFDGDHEAGIQVLNTSDFADDNGPLRENPVRKFKQTSQTRT